MEPVVHWDSNPLTNAVGLLPDVDRAPKTCWACDGTGKERDYYKLAAIGERMGCSVREHGAPYMLRQPGNTDEKTII